MATAAAAVKGGGAPSNRAAACNIWALDQIWKARIAQEHRAYKKWPMDWGFMATDYKDLVKDEIRPLDRPKLEMPETLRLPPITPIEKYIKVDKSPPLPRSSAGYIGWRSGDKLYNLERYGGYARGKGGLIRQLKWPDEGVD
ncbi:ciliary microtubule inner protein 1-like [Branchiostoma floridae x Branchiostoma japonicum]